jgi:hypothetical protein
MKTGEDKNPKLTGNAKPSVTEVRLEPGDLYSKQHHHHHHSLRGIAITPKPNERKIATPNERRNSSPLFPMTLKRCPEVEGSQDWIKRSSYFLSKL